MVEKSIPFCNQFLTNALTFDIFLGTRIFAIILSNMEVISFSVGKIQDVMIPIFRETKQNLGKLTGVACLQPSSISFLFVLCFLIHKKHKETQFSSILTKDTFILCICPLVLTTLKVINLVSSWPFLDF